MAGLAPGLHVKCPFTLWLTSRSSRAEAISSSTGVTSYLLPPSVRELGAGPVWDQSWDSNPGHPGWDVGTLSPTWSLYGVLLRAKTRVVMCGHLLGGGRCPRMVGVPWSLASRLRLAWEPRLCSEGRPRILVACAYMVTGSPQIRSTLRWCWGPGHL